MIIEIIIVGEASGPKKSGLLMDQHSDADDADDLSCREC